MADEEEVGLDAGEHEEEELDGQQMLALMFQQNQLLMQWMKGGGKGKGKGKGGFGKGDGEEPAQFMKPTVAPEFSGAGYEAWRKRVREWESIHFALHPMQKAGLLMAGLKGEALELARATVPADRLHEENSFQLLMDALRQHYGDNAALRQFRKFQSLVSIENNTDNLEAYLRQFTIRVQDSAEENLVLPEILQVYMLLNGSKLHPGQLQQVLATTEQMAAAHGAAQPRLEDVKHVLKSMAQARNLRSGPGRRNRTPAFAALGDDEESQDEAQEVEGEQGEDDDGDWNDEVDEEELNENPEYIAAVAAATAVLKRQFGKSKKGAKAGKTGRRNGRKPPGKGPKASQPPRDCHFVGEKDGEMKCHKLRDNKKCEFKHSKEDLDKAREKIKAKGAVPTFNAWDASESFEDLTKHLGSKCIVDSGAKKPVTGEQWLKRYEQKLKAFRKKVTNVPRRRGERPRTFQFGGGMKTSKGRKRVPFLVRTAKGGMEWRDVVLDIVPGWMPLLFAYDSMKHHRMFVIPEDDKLYMRDENGCEVVTNAGVDARTGILALDMLPDPRVFCDDTLSDHGNGSPYIDDARYMAGLGPLREVQSNRALVTLDGNAPGEVPMPDDPESDGTHSSMPGLEYPDTDSENLDIEDDEAVLAAFAPVATGSQASLWKSLTKTPECGTNIELSAAAMTVGSSVGEKEAEKKLHAVEQQSGVDFVVEKPRAVLLSKTSEEPKSGSSLEASPVSLNEANTQPETGDSPEASPTKTNRRSKKKSKQEKPEVHGTSKDEPRKGSTTAKEQKPAAVSVDLHVTGSVSATPKPLDGSEDGGGVRAPQHRKVRTARVQFSTERDKVHRYAKHLHDPEGDDTFAYLHKRSDVRPITRERLKHLHQLTHHTMSTSQLEHLLHRAQVPNVRQALDWYRDIVAKCGCGLAEYMHRHRVPRLHLRDTCFNEEVEMDVMKLGGYFWLVAVCRGTLLPMAMRMPNRNAATVRDTFLRMWVLLFGAPARGISDCGGEFLSREFLEATDLFSICKEATPAYASDRHGIVERVIRTIREAAERALRGAGQRLKPTDLDLIVAIILNEATNDLQPCGTSAAERAYGRTTSPFLSLLQHPVMPAPSALASLSEAARRRWREVANDRKFQELLTIQLGPQARSAANPPEHGSLVYYRRPSPMDDGPVYRGPAIVIGTDHATEQAYLTHGGLLVRAAYEHLRPAPGQKTPRNVPTTPDGSPEAVLEELDERDGSPAEPPADLEPPVVVVQSSAASAPPPLEPAPPPDGYGAHVIVPADELGPQTAAIPGAVMADEPADLSGSQPASAPDAHSAPAEQPAAETGVTEDAVPASPSSAPATPAPAPPFAPQTPAANLGADWFDDGADEPAITFLDEAAEVFAFEDADAELEEIAMDPTDVAEDPGDVTAPLLEEADDPDVAEPHYGLELNDVIAVKSGRQWRTGRVFGLDERIDRVSVEWEGLRAHEERFESLNLAGEEWRKVPRSRRQRGLSPDPALMANMPGERGGVHCASGGTALVLAAIAALEAKFSSGGGGVPQPPSATPPIPAPPRSCPTILTALISHSPDAKRHADAVPNAEGPEPPSRLPCFVKAELEAHLEKWEANGLKDKAVEDLQRAGALIADMFAGTLYLALAGYLERAPLVASSDTTALDGFSALGLLVGDADWRTALCKSTRALLSAAAKDAVTPKLVGEFLVMIEQGIAAESGVRRAAVPVLAALGVDTQVYQYTEEDLTPEMIKEGAKAELEQFDTYKVWGSDFEKAPPKGAVVMDAKYFSKPKVKNVKGKPVLIAKGRLTPKGFQDPEKYLHRVDSPTVARWVFYVVLMVGVSLGWEFIKADISGAFLQGEELSRDNVWVRMPQELVDLGLVPPDKRYRRVVKAVYGMNEAPRKWWRALTETAKALGFAPSLLDPCLLLLQEEGRVVCVIMVYVDDLIIAGNKEKALQVLNSLSAKYPMGQQETSWDQSTFSYTGKDVVFERDAAGRLSGVRVNQTAYIKSKFPEVAEVPAEVAKKSPQELLSPAGADWYRTANGRLAWTGNTRPQNAFDISECASGAKAPTVAEAKRLGKVIRGVLETAEDSLYLPRVDPDKLGSLTHADGSFANRGERTQGGYCTFLTSMTTDASCAPGEVVAGMVDFKSHKIARVCNCTYDAETIETVEGTDVGLSVSYLVTELRYGRLPSLAERVLLRGYGHESEVAGPLVSTRVLNDGMGTITSIYSTKPVTNKRRMLDVALLREVVDSGKVGLGHCPTDKMCADALTKRMPTDAVRKAACRGRVYGGDTSS